MGFRRAESSPGSPASSCGVWSCPVVLRSAEEAGMRRSRGCFFPWYGDGVLVPASGTADRRCRAGFRAALPGSCQMGPRAALWMVVWWAGLRAAASAAEGDEGRHAWEKVARRLNDPDVEEAARFAVGELRKLSDSGIYKTLRYVALGALGARRAERAARGKGGHRLTRRSVDPPFRRSAILPFRRSLLAAGIALCPSVRRRRTWACTTRTCSSR